MPKEIARRKARAVGKTATAKVTPYQVQVLAALLENIYWNGFEHRGTAYRIARSRLRDLTDVERLEPGTMKKLIERVKEDGFVLYTVDKGDYARAREWILDKREKLKKLPLADDTAIKNADERSEDVPY
jgi:DNA-binding MarR family transcriptional regulator